MALKVKNSAKRERHFLAVCISDNVKAVVWLFEESAKLDQLATTPYALS